MPNRPGTEHTTGSAVAGRTTSSKAKTNEWIRDGEVNTSYHSRHPSLWTHIPAKKISALLRYRTRPYFLGVEIDSAYSISPVRPLKYWMTTCG